MVANKTIITKGHSLARLSNSSLGITSLSEVRVIILMTLVFISNSEYVHQSDLCLLKDSLLGFLLSTACVSTPQY